MHLSLHWRQNDHDGVSNHQPHGCLLTGLCVGTSPGPVNSPHKGPVTRKLFPFDDVIMPSHRNSDYFQTHVKIADTISCTWFQITSIFHKMHFYSQITHLNVICFTSDTPHVQCLCKYDIKMPAYIPLISHCLCFSIPGYSPWCLLRDDTFLCFKYHCEFHTHLWAEIIDIHTVKLWYLLVTSVVCIHVICRMTPHGR